MLIEIKRRFSGRVLFSHDVKNNTVRLTLAAAITARIDLRGSDLRGSDLRGSNLSCSNLRGSDLRGSNLSCSDLSGSNLSCSNLSGSNLSCSDLRGSNLRGSNLSCSDLSGSNLSCSDLRGSDLRGSNLSCSNLRGVKNEQHALAQTVITPEGAFIGWKQCNDNVIVKLRIPDDARRSNATGRKCRAEFVDVVDVFGSDVGITNGHGPRTEYRVRERVHCNKWDENRWNECSGGIHFFLTREEAEAW